MRHGGLRWALLAAALILLSLGLAPAMGANTAVAIENFSYAPSSVTVSVGDTVTWTNFDNAPHNAVADDGSFDTNPGCGSVTTTACMSKGQSKSITFTKPGRFNYHCAVHGFVGTLIVQSSAGPTTTAAPVTTTAPRSVTSLPPAVATTSQTTAAPTSTTSVRPTSSAAPTTGPPPDQAPPPSTPGLASGGLGKGASTSHHSSGSGLPAWLLGVAATVVVVGAAGAVAVRTARSRRPPAA
jgi:plastocyanin